MSLKFNCPGCAATLVTPDEMAGRQIRCGRCEFAFIVPGSLEAPPSPPRGRGLRFWLLTIFGVLILGSFALCGGGYLLLPSERWSRYESESGGYTVDVPIQPNPNLRVPGAPRDTELTIEGGVLWKRGEAYVVMHGETRPKHLRAASDEQLLRDAVQAMTDDPAVRQVVRDEAIQVSGFPAREVEFVGNNGGTYVSRVIIADHRVYILTGGGRFVRSGNANIRRFIDSFEVTDPTLQGGVAFQRKQQEEAARKEAERIAAEEKAKKEAAHRAKENEAFRTAPYTGPRPGDPRALSISNDDVIYLSLDQSFPSGIGEWRQTRPVLEQAKHGAGVLGQGAYFTKSTRAQEMAISTESPSNKGRRGFTLSGWYKARHHTIDLFSITTHFGSSTQNAYIWLRVQQQTLVASTRSQGRTLEVAAPRPADNKWHHVAVVHDQTGDTVVVTLYIDGKKAAHGPGMRTDLGVSRLWVGSPHTAAAAWHQLTDSEGNPVPPAADDFIGAIDECCLIDGPLVEADVRKLAGLEPMSPRTLKQYGPKLTLPFEVPDPNRIAGLRSYFSFEEQSYLSAYRFPQGLSTCDTVGRKGNAEGYIAETIAGPRGRAMRATPLSNNFGQALRFLESPKYTVGLGVNKEEAFTLAFWVRTEDDTPGPSYLLRTQGSNREALGYRHIYIIRDRRTGEIHFSLTTDANSKSKEDKIATTRPGGKPNEWTHMAFTRDGSGTFRISVNGDVKTVPGKAAYEIRINSLTFGYGFENAGKTPYSIEIDELCIFDRALTDDELAALAGRKALPKQK